MRKNLIVALRILETLLLVGVGYTLRRSMAEQTGSFFFLNISLNISVAHHVEEVILQTTVFGYIISQVTTMLTPSSASSKYFRISLLLSLLGIITFVLELVRFFVGYELRVLLDTAAALVFVDWMLTFAMLKMPKPVAAVADPIIPNTNPPRPEDAPEAGGLTDDSPGKAERHPGGIDAEASEL